MRQDGLKWTRREFVMTAMSFYGFTIFGEPTSDVPPLVRFGLVTDLHYADIDPRPGRGERSRYFRESLRKLDDAVAVFNGRKPNFVIELGDFKDNTRGHDETIKALVRIEQAFSRFEGPRYHVAGNHDFDCISPEEFFSLTPNNGKTTEKGWYSFVAGGVTFVVLNACFTSDGKPYCRNNPWTDANVPSEEMEWLKKELAATKGHVVVFCHQRLDPAAERHHLVKNAAAVRKTLEDNGKVRAVIMGHQHGGGQSVVNGIPYYCLRAMVCDTGKDEGCYAEAALYPSGAFAVTGWRRAKPMKFSAS
ncbi:MAG: metallophosphoesterase [Kiritimatiellae bacterium]|nr:metallophosphoesterase [Kiritimatiellia bacterium]